MTTALEPKDKLDVAPDEGAVNGPEGDSIDWFQMDWDAAEGNVRRLRQRIFTASQAGDLAKVRNLQKLMLRSRSNTLVSVRRVTQINAGRKTAGIDGKTALLPQQKAELADWVQHRSSSWTSRTVKRVFIPKAGNTKRQRPLGIPVLADRALQARVVNALEPEWEARFESRSYGFRPGRGCHDAIEAIYGTCKGKRSKRVWILDADLAAAFDHLDHDHLLNQLGTFPATGMVVGWLKAGVVDRGRFAPTEEGAPQGGVISPLLLNVVLHGMEEAAGVRYLTGTHVGHTAPGSPVVIRYADDLVALCHTREEAEQVKARLAEWLAPKGLSFNENKTRILHLTGGFDFLGCHVRRYVNGKLIIKPSKAAVQRIRERLRTEMRALRGANAAAVLQRLNPIIRGWAAYYRTVVSKHVFTTLDAYVWWLVFKWAVRSHRNKPKHWVRARYFGAFNKARRDNWVFGDRHTGAYLTKFAWTKIVRHQMVDGFASPDDPKLADYWTARRRRSRKPPLNRDGRRLIARQRGRCPLCGNLLLHAHAEPQHPDEWEQWITATRKAIRAKALTVHTGRDESNDLVVLHLVHADCARRHDRRGSPALPHARDAPGLA
ncbi:RNA-directed DNA polymerase [Haloechinothrix alba]|uniref:RNA-directed DNA polymerase n=1 Tax=Haloechinothrix alba TaxID=664784 RepID=A0A239AN18_9PSEU|nr:group II intron reverse transcriptase/maturase [Haloechinothrix alba]SNR96454.1 RNA-directed DNA polymerase [Haloechinothrix alba]